MHKKSKLPRWEKGEEFEPEFLEKLRGFNTNQAHRLNDEIELPHYKNFRRIVQFLVMKLPGIRNRTKKWLITFEHKIQHQLANTAIFIHNNLRSPLQPNKSCRDNNWKRLFTDYLPPNLRNFHA
jgi:hypothetical protein